VTIIQKKGDGQIPLSWYEKYSRNPTKFTPTEEDIRCELQLQALDSFELLEPKINLNQFERELSLFDNDWEPYQPKPWVTNNREALVLSGLEGSTPSENLSVPEARIMTGNKRLLDVDFNHKTEVYHELKSLHPLLEPFGTLGRTFLVKVNAGGWFPPHKDYPLIIRKTIRIVAFLSKNCDSDSFEWSHSGVKQDIIPGRAYWVDTMKAHRTHSWKDNSIHLIVNIPKTWENVLKLCSMTYYK